MLLLFPNPIPLPREERLTAISMVSKSILHERLVSSVHVVHTLYTVRAPPFRDLSRALVRSSCRMAELLTVVAEMKAKPGQEAKLREALIALVAPTRQEEGCVQYDLHEKTDEPGRFVFYENWVSADHLTRHSASAHIQAFRSRAGDLLGEPARIETYARIA